MVLKHKQKAEVGWRKLSIAEYTFAPLNGDFPDANEPTVMHHDDILKGEIHVDFTIRFSVTMVAGATRHFWFGMGHEQSRNASIGCAASNIG